MGISAADRLPLACLLDPRAGGAEFVGLSVHGQGLVTGYGTVRLSVIPGRALLQPAGLHVAAGTKVIPLSGDLLPPGLHHAVCIHVP